MTELERFEPRVEPALLLIEEAEEEHDGRLELGGHHIGVGAAPRGRGVRLEHLAGRDLLAAL